MKVLIIKMTSMGDIIHTFPALTDAGKAIPGIKFDWIVENAFKEVPAWHPLVDRVFPVAFRKWRKAPLKTLFSGEMIKAIKQIRQQKYDLIIDAQGLLKSTIVSTLAKGTRCGFDKKSARESWANFLYQKKITVAKGQHAVMRIRHLFAKALNYDLSEQETDYGLQSQSNNESDYLVFMPNTTWDTKHYPENYWLDLIKLASQANYEIKIPWGAPHEEERAKRLAENHPQVTVLPRMSLTEVANIIAHAKAAVALDTGLAHIAAAYATPTISLYGPTDPKLTGTYGRNQVLLSADFECAPCFKRQCQYPGDKTVNPPCFTRVPPDMVWGELKKILKK